MDTNVYDPTVFCVVRRRRIPTVVAQTAFTLRACCFGVHRRRSFWTAVRRVYVDFRTQAIRNHRRCFVVRFHYFTRNFAHFPIRSKWRTRSWKYCKYLRSVYILPTGRHLYAFYSAYFYRFMLKRWRFRVQNCISRILEYFHLLQDTLWDFVHFLEHIYKNLYILTRRIEYREIIVYDFWILGYSALIGGRRGGTLHFSKIF